MQTDFINQTTQTEASTWILKNTSWAQTGVEKEDYFTDSNYYELFIQKDGRITLNYFISSRYVRCASSIARFRY